MKLLVLRPEPGASATAARAAELGLTAVVAPLFTTRPLGWSPPDPARYDAVMMTSANAVRLGGPDLGRYVHLPAYAVGASTAAAMRAVGFTDVTTGSGDAEALAERIARGPHRKPFHPCGAHFRASASPLAIDHVPVYVSSAESALPPAARDALADGALALLHSPRAAALLAKLAHDMDRAAVRLVAISPAAAAAAGPGWRTVAAAPEPTDAAMLAIAAELCKNPAR